MEAKLALQSTKLLNPYKTEAGEAGRETSLIQLLYYAQFCQVWGIRKHKFHGDQGARHGR